jgi:hypothetical protein
MNTTKEKVKMESIPNELLEELLKIEQNAFKECEKSNQQVLEAKKEYWEKIKEELNKIT